MNAVFLDYKSLTPEDLNIQKIFDLPFQFTVHDATSHNQTAERIQNAEVVLTNKVVLDKELLEKNNQLKLVIILATGTNNVDLSAAKSCEIPVCNIRDYSSESVAQHTIACLLQLTRRLHEYRHAVESGGWSNSPFFCMTDFSISDLSGQTMGIIGYGAIAKRVHKLAEAFGMDVLISKSLVPGKTPKKDRVDLHELYKNSDVISIHCPLSPQSKNLIDFDAFSLMKNSAILLNMARGGIVNEKDLLHAIQNKTIKAAATDVLTQEPPPKNHILLRESYPNLLITPHVAWASRQSRQQLVDQVYRILDEFLKGNVVNRVN